MSRRRCAEHANPDTSFCAPSSFKVASMCRFQTKSLLNSELNNYPLNSYHIRHKETKIFPSAVLIEQIYGRNGAVKDAKFEASVLSKRDNAKDEILLIQAASDLQP
ncbi:hypothetical protein EGR_03404 [Echinococcus granulosus]|uniref:Uncharacterized protein n=1 Tax=Echinococcus granulosus TaxID=6210 RepID=W6ULB1_ECHGR|nr:hypothetical protein EGR_03404 [Echinococcus granulosus]EUB61858.1 hypothetical protein EGR_03404 [Echinococcus granulosus]